MLSNDDDEFESSKSEPEKVLNSWKLMFDNKLNLVPALFGIELL